MIRSRERSRKREINQVRLVRIRFLNKKVISFAEDLFMSRCLVKTFLGTTKHELKIKIVTLGVYLQII